jgi:hypothetical protein
LARQNATTRSSFVLHLCRKTMSWLSISVAAHAFANVLLKNVYLLQVHQLQNISHTHTLTLKTTLQQLTPSAEILSKQKKYREIINNQLAFDQMRL